VPSSHFSGGFWVRASPQNGAAPCSRACSRRTCRRSFRVADLVAGDDAVAAGRRARGDRVDEAAQRQRVRRRAGVSFGLEEVDRVHVTVDEAECRGLGCIDRDALARCAVNTAEVDDERAVDERPDVVVAVNEKVATGALATYVKG